MSWARCWALAACVLMVLSAQPGLAQFQAGVGKRIITPDPLLPLSGGVGEPKPSTKKMGELTARALVLSDGKTTVAIVGTDLLGFPSVLGDRVKKLVPRIPAESILIGATHTHSGPDCYAFPLPTGGHTGDLAYMQMVCEKTAEAINEALDGLQPALLRVNTDVAAEGMAFNYYAPQLYDRRMSVLQARTPDGKVIGTMVNYAIHPEVLGNALGITSPDCIGPLYDELEKQVGGMALFMNGAQGGMITADNRDLSQQGNPRTGVWPGKQTWEECLRIGHTMADEAVRIVDKAPNQPEATITNLSRRVEFPVESPLMRAILAGSPLKYPYTEDFKVTVQMNLVTIGNCQLLTIPGEALPNIGFYLKRKMHGEHNLLLGLTNDAFGYILTEVDFNSFERYAYVSRTSLGEMTGEILIENALQMISEKPAK